MKQAQGVGVVRVVITDFFGQSRTCHGHVHGGIPKTRKRFNGFIAHRTFNADAIDDINDTVEA